MLGSLRIKGFRAFDDLTIQGLGHVNLIVGRNNVGKSTLLEAVRLYAARELAASEAVGVLEARDEFVHSLADDAGDFRGFHRLFFAGDPGRRIEIGPVDAPERTVQLYLGWSQWIREEGGRTRTFQVEEPDANEGADFDRVVAVEWGGSRRLLSLELSLDRWRRDWFVERERTARGEVGQPCSFVLARGFDEGHAAKLWDGIALSDLEEKVIRALQIVEPSLERVAFVGEADAPRPRRVALAKCRNRSPEPLKSLGDGMNRIFEISLGLVSAQKGYLLIDEFENGIHYSAQPDLWRMLFDVATALHVQVFATTHSWDCIAAFQMAASEHPSEGVLVRLEQGDGAIRATCFHEDELAILTRESIEVR